MVAAGNPPFSPPISYQWRFNRVDIPGETFPIFGLDHLVTNQSGGYSVIVSNAVGGAISDIAILNVTEGITSPQLTPVGSSYGQFSFGIWGDVGRLYRIQSSTNLVNWSEWRAQTAPGHSKPPLPARSSAAYPGHGNSAVMGLRTCCSSPMTAA